MDYSLLVGVHFREVTGSGEPVTTETRNSGVRTPTGIHVFPHSFFFLECYMKNDLISSFVSANADQSSDVSTPRISRADMDLLFDPSG